jgi:large subunit ribosomal protein L18
MQPHTKKMLTKQSQHTRRKNRTNTSAKAQSYDVRILVHKSLQHVTAQLIAPTGDVLLTTSDKDASGDTKTDRAFAAGKSFATELAKHDFSRIIFDRNGFRYHGRVKAFADGIREGGISL